jgi:hypothetical protein
VQGVKRPSIHLDKESREGLDRAANISRLRADLIRAGIDHGIGEHLPRQLQLLDQPVNLGTATQSRVDETSGVFGR